MFAFLFSVTVLPAVLAIFPARAPRATEGKATILARLSHWLIARRKQNFALVAVVAICLAACIPLIQLDDRFVQYFDESITFRTDTDHINKKLTGVYTLAFDLESGETEGISDPQYLAKLESFSAWLRQQPEVIHVSTISDIFKRINKNMHNDDPAYYTMPELKDLASQYLLLYEMSLPFGLDLTTLTNVDKSASKVVATMHDASTVEIRAFETRSNAWIADNAQGVLSGIAASPSVMFSHISQRNVEAMIFGTVFSLILITLVLMVAMKSIRFGILSLVPNVLPIAMGFGLWGILVGNIGMAVATVAGLTLGIVVDDTVHVISKYLRARREGLSPEASVEKSYAAVGRALIITSIILVCGFLIMSQSTFRMNWSLGMLSGMTIFCALVADLLMLPALLIGGERIFAKKSHENDGIEQANDSSLSTNERLPA